MSLIEENAETLEQKTDEYLVMMKMRTWTRMKNPVMMHLTMVMMQVRHALQMRQAKGTISGVDLPCRSANRFTPSVFKKVIKKIHESCERCKVGNEKVDVV
ncbi:uncharacterized protein DS421_4g122720 [Arachis hypogaea]|nr:uncharacterized protein DS421_4g122720 [Arachis hypogaea]